MSSDRSRLSSRYASLVALGGVTLIGLYAHRDAALRWWTSEGNHILVLLGVVGMLSWIWVMAIREARQVMQRSRSAAERVGQLRLLLAAVAATVLVLALFVHSAILARLFAATMGLWFASHAVVLWGNRAVPASTLHGRVLRILKWTTSVAGVADCAVVIVLSRAMLLTVVGKILLESMLWLALLDTAFRWLSRAPRPGRPNTKGVLAD